MNGSGQYLYEEPSNDLGLWLFIGDTSNWENPLFELVPVEDTSDKWVDYWLPHVQIDLDTKLDAKSIEKLSKEHFGNDILPYQVTVIDGIVYAVRLRLGVIDGVNINLDLGTSNRNTKYVRENLLRRV